MKRDKAASYEVDANSVLKKHLSAAQRKKRKKIITIVTVSVIVLAAIAIAVLTLQKSVSEKYGSTDSSVESTKVTVGSINSTVSGTGTLADDDVEDVEVPTAVNIDTMCVEEGDTVKEGDAIATVDTASVVSAMADVQDQIDSIDSELKDVSDDSISNKIKAGVSGRVKKIYAEKGDDIASVMYDKGALMLLSLDGLMAVDIDTDADVEAADTVSVTLSDGSTVDGTVESVKDKNVTVTLTDNGPELDEAVTVKNKAGNELGTGKLYIHSEFKITGYAGTVSKVYVTENKKVSSSTKLFYLTDTSYAANYDTLLEQRASLEDSLDELVKLYKEGAIYSPIDGVISSVDYDEDSDSSTASSNSNTTSSTSGTSASTSGTSASTSSTSTGSDSSATDSDSSDDHTLIATVCPNSTMSVTVNLDESDILSLKEGQEATVTIDSIGDDEFKGTVTDVNKTGTSSGGVTVFTVEVTIDKTDQMFAGMSASVDIITDSVDNVLYIPDDALQQTSSTAYVYTEYDEETKELAGMVEVTIGLDNGTNVEIKSGLNEGDTVYYNASEDDSQSNSMGNWNGNMNGSGGNGFPQGQGNQGGGMPGGMPGGGGQ